MKIGIVTQTIRDSRYSLIIANWVKIMADNKASADFAYEIIDLKDYQLPLYGITPSTEEAEVITKWSNKLNEMDGYIFVTAEYNHAPTGVFKNAIDYVKPEFNNKAAAFVGYGYVGGARAIDVLRLILVEYQLAMTQKPVLLNLNIDFNDKHEFVPKEYHLEEINLLLEQIQQWTKAMATLR